MRFIDHRVHLVTGKGGVGKTTVSVAMARALAASGRHTLVCEIGDPNSPWSPVGRLFDVPDLGAQPTRVADHLDACVLDATLGQELFLRSILPAGPLIRAALRSRSLSRFLIAAPSFFEMGIFQHLLSLLEQTKPRYDFVIVDMPATGHALALTALPEILLRLIPKGPMAKALRRGQAFLNDPANAAAWVVALPETLPVTEALELAAGLRETAMHVGGILLNRVPALQLDPPQRAALADWLGDRAVHGQLTLGRIASAAAADARLAAAPYPVRRLTEIADPARLAEQLA